MSAEVGHNSGLPNASRDQLRSIVERVENLEGEKAEIAADIRDVYTEAKSNGFDAKTIRKIVALRKKDPEKRQEEDVLLDAYMFAMGMA
jgi:uncharacterized protein (UPF0335 family)